MKNIKENKLNLIKPNLAENITHKHLSSLCHHFLMILIDMMFISPILMLVGLPPFTNTFNRIFAIFAYVILSFMSIHLICLFIWEITNPVFKSKKHFFIMVAHVIGLLVLSYLCSFLVLEHQTIDGNTVVNPNIFLMILLGLILEIPFCLIYAKMVMNPLGEVLSEKKNRKLSTPEVK